MRVIEYLYTVQIGNERTTKTMWLRDITGKKTFSIMGKVMKEN